MDNRLRNELFAKRVVHFYNEISGLNKNETVKHFLAEGAKENTLYGIIRRYHNTGTADYKPLSGRKPTVSTKKNIRKVKNRLIIKNLSVRKTGLELDIKRSTVQYIKKKNDIKSAKCQIAPKYTDNQMKRVKTNCRKLYRNSIGRILVLDDETYVMADPKNIPGNKFYHFVDKSKVKDKVRFRPKEKFPKKYLVWQAIDECGHISEPYVKVGTMKADEYRTECLQKRLIPFIEKYHDIEDVLFWPDLATIHYQIDVRNWMSSQNLSFVSKTANAPNVPQARPIEKYWALSKSKFGQRSRAPKNIIGFKKVWRTISEDVAKSSAKKLMGSVRRRLRLIGDKGVFAPLKEKN